MALRDGGDDVLRAEGRVAAEEHLGQRGLEGLRVEHRHVPLVELDADVALDPREGVSWPMATSTSSHSISTSGSPVGTRLRRPLASYSARTFSKVTPRACRCRAENSFGTRKLMDRDAFVHASSFSHGEAFISSKPLRTMTLTSVPPRRRAERQQSIAVLPPPRTMTRGARIHMAEGDVGQPVDADVDVAAASWRPGMSASRAARRAGADEDRVPLVGEHLAQAVHPAIETLRRRG